MASISHNKTNGRRSIQFTNPDGGRKTVRLGKVSQKSAAIIKTQVEMMLEAKGLGTPLKPQTTAWLKTISPTVHKRLAAAGLIEGRKTAVLGEYLADYIARRASADAKPLTVKKWRTTERILKEYFGEGRDLRTITAGDADAFRLHLIAQRKKDGITPKYRPASLGKHIVIARVFLNAARRDRVVEQNPFEGFAISNATDKTREQFIPIEDTEKCIEAAPDSQWRTIIALARYGGLRTPSEIVRLKWDDILWDEERMIVHSPKTEHHEGKELRIVPLFPELRKHLEEAYEIAPTGSEFVITRYRDAEANLRTTFSKIIKRAGLKPWPKLFQNLRASRQTELEEEFPTHVVCSWLGNSPKVARRHYLQTTESHFEKATQKATQYTSASGGKASHDMPYSPGVSVLPEEQRGKKSSPRTRTRNETFEASRDIQFH